MIITTPGYMQTRSLEVGLATLMAVCGLVFLQPGVTTSYPLYTELRSWMHGWITEEQGGALLIIVALLRYFALWRNSHLKASPIFRMAGCGIGAAFWLALATSIANSYQGPVPLLLAMTSAAAGKELYSAFRTGLDADVLDSFGYRRWAFYRREKERRKRWKEEAGA